MKKKNEKKYIIHQSGVYLQSLKSVWDLKTKEHWNHNHELVYRREEGGTCIVLRKHQLSIRIYIHSLKNPMLHDLDILAVSERKKKE